MNETQAEVVHSERRQIKVVGNEIVKVNGHVPLQRRHVGGSAEFFGGNQVHRVQRSVATVPFTGPCRSLKRKLSGEEGGGAGQQSPNAAASTVPPASSTSPSSAFSCGGTWGGGTWGTGLASENGVLPTKGICLLEDAEGVLRPKQPISDPSVTHQ